MLFHTNEKQRHIDSRFESGILFVNWQGLKILKHLPESPPRGAYFLLFLPFLRRRLPFFPFLPFLPLPFLPRRRDLLLRLPLPFLPFFLPLPFLRLERRRLLLADPLAASPRLATALPVMPATASCRLPMVSLNRLAPSAFLMIPSLGWDEHGELQRRCPAARFITWPICARVGASAPCSRARYWWTLEMEDPLRSPSAASACCTKPPTRGRTMLPLSLPDVDGMKAVRTQSGQLCCCPNLYDGDDDFVVVVEMLMFLWIVLW